MANSWSKQPVWVGGYINNVNDSIVGGQLSSVPSGVIATQGEQTQLGDHLVLDEAAAQAKSTTASGYAQCHGGYYQYVQFDSAATTPALGQALYWKLSLTTTATGNYAVTNVSTGNTDAFAGVLLNPNVTAGNFTWIQCLGRATVSINSGQTTTVGGAIFVSGAGFSNGAGTTTTSVGVAESVTTGPTTIIAEISKSVLRF
jgi:hypothetical protein